jgi:hypothetical protein
MSVRIRFVGASCAAAMAALAGCNAAPGAGPAASGADAIPAVSKTVSFASDVKPILELHCRNCHLGGGKKGGFNMDSRENALLAGRNGARIVEGNGAGSSLVLRVAHDPSVKKMPAKGEALNADEVATLKAWIDQGVKWE